MQSSNKKLYELYTVPQIRKKLNQKQNEKKSSNTIVKDSLIVKKQEVGCPLHGAKYIIYKSMETNWDKKDQQSFLIRS